MAVNLARSFRLWNADNGINFYLATDQLQYVPDDLKTYVKIITVKPGELGEGFSPKLHLDKLAPEGQTLFIDSDCLVYGNLVPVFASFKGRSVSVIGNYISDGEWFGNIAAICRKFNIAHLPKFNGGIYYIERGQKASIVYGAARAMEAQYDEIGFVRLRKRPNDEVLMALAIQLNGETPVADDGTVLAEFVNFQSGIKSDLLNGFAELYNKPGHPNYQKNWPLTISKPLIVHFLGHHNQVMPYTGEIKKLEYIFSNKYSAGKARFLAAIKIAIPSLVIAKLKQLFRPVFHLVIGTRKVKKSERVID